MNWTELVAALLSVWCVWLAAQRRMLNFPVAVAGSLLYGWVFFKAHLYSDALLQGAFIAFIIYGWYRWVRNLGNDGRVTIASLPFARGCLNVGVGIIGALALGYVMHTWTNATLPWLDSTLTAFSLVAQWWQDRRHAVTWWLWIIVDVFYVGEYIYKDLYITSALYAGFVVLCVFGLRAWRRAGEHAMQVTASGGQASA